MKNYKNTLFYLAVTGGFSALMYWIIQNGKLLEGTDVKKTTIGPKDAWLDFIASMQHSFQEPLAILLAQIITIIIVARVFGWIFKKIGQPSVIGEIIAGIALGMELDLKVLKNKANDAVVISHASIVIPFTLGIGLAYFVYDQFAPSGVKFLSFSLFMGIAMSITAFPVLARIVQERGIHKTKLGAIVITCAAADDITAWCLLAAVIAIVKAGSFVSSLYVISLAVGFVLIMLLIVKPFLKRIGDLYASKEAISKPVVAIFFVTLIIASYATEVIGIHALF